jgi:peroxiredoxin Q/BCP
MASRVTFLVGPDGKVAKVYPDVDPGLHATEVLQDAAALR